MAALNDDVERAPGGPVAALAVAAGPGQPVPPPRWIRGAASAPFLITGLVFASYFVRIPSLKLELGLSEGELGVFLMLPVLSALAAMQLTGRLVARLGSGTLLRIVMVALPLSLLAFATARGRLGFAVVLLVFGAVDGLIDISMNAHAITAERALGHPIMNSCHAAWSIGSAVGSLLGGVALKAGLSLTQHYALVAGAMIVVAGSVGRHLMPARADRVAPGAEVTSAGRRARPTWRSGWTTRLLLLALTGTVVLMVSGVVGSWSGVYLHDDLGASLALASLGYVGYSVFEAGARLIGDRLHQKLGASLLVRYAGVIAVTGLAAVVLSPGPVVAIVGFAGLGLGLSVVVPIILGAVGHGGADPGSGGAADALAKVNTLTYTGMLVGPMVVGWSAQVVGLAATLAGMLVLLAAALWIGQRAV